MVQARRDGEVAGGPTGVKSAEVDSRGQFQIEGMAQGTYKLTLFAFNPNLDTPPKLPKVEQLVTLAANARQDVSLVLDLAQKEGDK